MKINAQFSRHGKSGLYIITIVTITVLVSIFFQSCGVAEETKVGQSNLISQAEAIQTVHNFVQQHYSADPYLKDKASPSSVTDKGDIWVIFYEDKTLTRLPSGLELAIDKKTGKIWRRNQE